MKYRAASEKCQCGNERRPGQRDCADCHVKSVRESRRKQEEPVEALTATMRKMVKKGPKRSLPAEMEQKLRSLAERVAREIESFNGSAA